MSKEQVEVDARRLVLVPVPRAVEAQAGTFRLRANQYIRLLGTDAGLLRFGANRFQQALRRMTGLMWSVIAGTGGPDDDVALMIAADSAATPAQGYRLAIRPEGIRIIGGSAAGAFHGLQTLTQIVRQSPQALPCLLIDDAPDFAARGVMLDISRDKVPTMQTLYELVDQLAEWKTNQVQLYTEHTFAYRAHPEVWATASPMTGEQIMALDAYCRERFIELVPNQNSFGHMERWLKLPRYIELAEAPEGSDTPWHTRWNGPFSLCPTDPRSLKLLEGLYDELLPHFSSGMLNVGCDETFDIGQGRSKQQAQDRGATRVYLDFLLQVYELARRRGRKMQFWGDIILHKPELIEQLPKDVIALEWGYDADHPFDRDGELFRRAGIDFYVCPGTSSWCTIAGRTQNAIANLRSAAENGLKHGAIGYLNTDWGDQGHLQYLPVSYLGFAQGAACSWSSKASERLDLAAALNVHAFADRAGVMGPVAMALGDVYRACGRLQPNASVLFRVLMAGQDVAQGMSRQDADRAEAAIDAALAPLEGARMDRPDAALIIDEFRCAGAMLRFACRMVRKALDASAENGPDMAAEMRRIVGEHRRLWLARNRVGGLADSAARLERLVGVYESAAARG